MTYTKVPGRSDEPTGKQRHMKLRFCSLLNCCTAGLFVYKQCDVLQRGYRVALLDSMTNSHDKKFTKVTKLLEGAIQDNHQKVLDICDHEVE